MMSYQGPHVPAEMTEAIGGAVNARTTTSRTATAEDLQNHRPYIERLYVDENMTLKEVTERMVQDYGLKPTYNMLRKRFRKWGIDNKKNNEVAMKAVIQKENERSRVGKASTFRHRGRSVQYRDVIRYWERKHMSVEDVLAQAHSREPTPDGLEVLTPIPSPILPPTVLEIPDRILRCIKVYMDDSFDSGIWCFVNCDSGGQIEETQARGVASWEALCLLIDQPIEILKSDSLNKAWQILRDNSASVKQKTLQDDPYILFVYVSATLKLLHHGHSKIAAMFIRSFTSLAETEMGQSHRMSSLLSQLGAIDIMASLDFLTVCLHKIRDCFINRVRALYMEPLKEPVAINRFYLPA